MIEVYDRLVADCGTINQLNRRHLSLELTLTPREVIDLERELMLSEDYWRSPGRSLHSIPAELHRIVARAWLIKLREFFEMNGKQRAEPFQRREVLRSVTHYSNGGEARGKWLVITLCGAAYRPMMAAPTYLQAFDAARVDVVLVRDYYLSGFRRGITDLSNSMEGAWHELPRLLESERYDGLAYLGTSGGALPALLFAMAAEARSAIAVGPSPPNDPNRRLPDGRFPAELLKSFASRTTLPAMTILYGRESLDRPAVDAIKALLPVKVVEINDPDTEVGHNAVLPLLRTGRLANFVAEHLGLPG